MKPFDFSCKHDVMIRNKDGSYSHMDEPYFETELVAPRTWKILSDGDFSYLVEGDNEAIVIDSGYGCGNIREYCQTLTDKPVYRIANTHEHFDHTANNGRFEYAMMSEKAEPLATIPFPSFEGIYFPRDYKKVILHEGDIIDLGGRELEVFEVPCHAQGSLAFLDRKGRMLFCGDEFGAMCNIVGSVAQLEKNILKMMKYRSEFDYLASGPDFVPAEFLEKNLGAAQSVLNGAVGFEPQMGFARKPTTDLPEGTKVYNRQRAHAEDLPKHAPGSRMMFEYEGGRLQYDPTKIWE